MSIWQDSTGNLHDDMGGGALTLSTSWSTGMTKLTDAQVAAIRAPSIVQVKSDKINSLQASYQQAIQQNVTYNTHEYQSDIQSQANLQSAIAGCMFSLATPNGFYWVAADNTQVPFTYNDLITLASIMFAQGAAAFQHFQTLKASVNAAVDIDTLGTIHW